jgi:hypothetical protein
MRRKRNPLRVENGIRHASRARNPLRVESAEPATRPERGTRYASKTEPATPRQQNPPQKNETTPPQTRATNRAFPPFGLWSVRCPSVVGNLSAKPAFFYHPPVLHGPMVQNV